MDTQIVLAIVSLIGTLATGIIGYFVAKLNKQQGVALEINKATHTLVNNNMAVQLKINNILADRIAALTGDKHDMLVAVEAKRVLSEHEIKQSIVDEQYAKANRN